MSRDPFLVLGISHDATQAEAESAYHTLRDKYRLDMHQEGERGKKAAEALTELDEAYRQVLDIIDNNVGIDGNVYTQIEQYLKENKYDEAQGLLDNVSERGAEWHYLQAALFYKKGWLIEARSQLQMACSMDPANQKYSNALNKMENRGNNNTTNNTSNNGQNYNNPNQNYGPIPDDEQQNGYNRSYGEYEKRRQADDTACAFCQGLMCANLCCNCLRCM